LLPDLSQYSELPGTRREDSITSVGLKEEETKRPSIDTQPDSSTRRSSPQVVRKPTVLVKLNRKSAENEEPLVSSDVKNSFEYSFIDFSSQTQHPTFFHQTTAAFAKMPRPKVLLECTPYQRVTNKKFQHSVKEIRDLRQKRKIDI
jgi:hypothetical protein